MGMSDLLTRLAAIKVVAEALRDAEKQTKHDLMVAGLGPGDRLHARVDGDDCGTVSMSSPSERFAVTDDRAFTRWCQENRPDAVVPTVRESDKRAILAAVPDTGEIPDGVESKLGPPTVSVRLTQDQRDALTAAIHAGAFSLPSLLELPDGGEG